MKTIPLMTVASLTLAPFAFSANIAVLTPAGAGMDQLSFFDTDSGPSSRVDLPLSGLAPGESLVGIDFRPATGVTYGISNSSNIYTVNTTSGGLTQLGTTLSPTLNGSTFGFDFNPAFMGGQFARIISNLDNNRVIDGDNGGYLGSVEKTAVFYAMGDANEGVDPNINHIAYTNSVFGAGSTQQYGIDTGLNALTTVANNAGTLTTVGGLGIDASELGGFDIDGASGRAFAALENADGLSSTLYEINLDTGAASELFSFQGGARGLTSIPEPSSLLLTSLAALAMLGRRKR